MKKPFLPLPTLRHNGMNKFIRMFSAFSWFGNIALPPQICSNE